MKKDIRLNFKFNKGYNYSKKLLSKKYKYKYKEGKVINYNYSKKLLSKKYKYKGGKIIDYRKINYRNMSVIYNFISEQGKILSRKINKVSLKQQRSIRIAIKQARILSFLPFLNSSFISFNRKIKKYKKKKL